MASNHADSKVIWMDGELLPYGEATVSVLSHSLHYGSAAFEGLRAYATTDGRTAIYRAVEHYERFFDSIRVMGYKTPYNVADLMAATTQCIRANGFQECYIRPLAYLDDGLRGLKVPVSSPARIAIACWPWGKYLGADSQARGIRIMISTFRRPDISSTLPWAKLSGNYLNSILARREASENGMDEALLLDPQGFVAEGSGENLFLVKKNVLFTPPEGNILPGITRDSVFQIARDLGLSVQVQPITRNQLYMADEAFFTGTAVEVTPIREIDRRAIGRGEPGPITQRISDVFFRSIRGDEAKYERWLTYV